MNPNLPVLDIKEVALSLALAAGLGLLVGLQREWEQNRIAGIRTFALVTLFGAVSGMLGVAFGGWVVAVALICFTAMIFMGNLPSLRQPNPDTGLTTEMALLVMFGVGVLPVLGCRMVAVIVAGAVMVLLQGKDALHGVVRRIGKEDLREIARLVLIGLVILPALPNESYGWFGVINPFEIWLMVVLIVGISLAAYLAAKFLGERRSMIVGGLLGGLISSTATTASLARQSAEKQRTATVPPLVVMTLLASTVVFARVIIEVCVAAPAVMQKIIAPLWVMMAWMGVVCVIAYRWSQRSQHPATPQSPPSEMKSAVLFGLLYALVLLAVAAAKHYFGSAGLYVVAAISGLTDMDAITLSTSKLANAGHVTVHDAWRVILTGGLANLAFKSGLVGVLGAASFRKPVIFGFLASMAGGVALLAFWP